MIKKIDIQKFGLFCDYNWDSEIGSDSTINVFKKVNIIYGRNYSGKTTLSRIFRCIENGELHKDYEDAKFTIYTNDGIIDQTNINCSKQIRVYNSDFVKTNLSWLHDNKGEILPFTLLGGDNTIIEGKLKEIDIELGVFDPVTQKDVETYKEGTLYFEENKKKQESITNNNKWRELTDNLESKIVGKAKEIKGDVFLVSQKDNYDKRNLKTEIDDILSTANPIVTFSNNDIIQFQEIIKEDKKDTVSQVSYVDFKLIDYIPQIKELVSRKITLSKVLTELVENDLLQAWVNQGRTLHKETDICGFCGNVITPERKKQLEEHFSKESDELKTEILKLSDKLNAEYSKIEKYWESNDMRAERFYAMLQTPFIDINNKWSGTVESMNTQIDFLVEKLNERFANPFKPLSRIDFSEIENNCIDLNLIIDELNLLIKDNEGKSTSIEQDKNKARKSLRYHTINTFIKDIDYTSLITDIKNKETEAKTSKTNYDELIKEIRGKEKEKEDLKKELRDEGRAANKINKHLIDFFGLDGLKLEPSEQQIDDKVITRFVVKRGDQEARNLSEGECSLVAFCYFMARIEDEIQAPDAKDKLIVYIDDPISSLDSNHIFFMYSLIESITVGVSQNNPKFCQLFISTHNLEFLKHLSNLHKYKNTETKYRQNFIIDKRKKDFELRSYLVKMPRYLRINISEYLYLFDEILKMANIENGTNDKIQYFQDNYTQLYAIGNIMRKFLECYICTKYPHIDSPFQHLSILFPNSIPLQINKIVQEYSHLQWGARASLPIDVSEAEEAAKKIIEALKVHDSEHYDSLIECIKKKENA
ncbi:MAG: hypothetical protein RL662_2542 [Bacteroidota bacterium]|jgi:wobble nucleotide-excising tRNase